MDRKLIIILIILLAAVFVAWRYFERPAELPSETIQEEPPEASSVIDTANWQTYKNDVFKFELKYPEELSYKYDSVFEPFDENVKKVLTVPLGEKPFQVFVVVNGLGALPTTTEENLIESKTMAVSGLAVNREVFKRGNKETISGLSFRKDGVLYSIWAEIIGEPAEKLKIFDQLLSTFKLLP